MEKSRAIELLKLAVPIKAFTQQEYSDFVEAVNMGVDALEQPTTSDTISRQAALDALDKRFDNIPMEQTAEILMLRKDLRELPTAQPEPHGGYCVEYKCSKCGYKDFVEPGDEYWFKRNYCPNCGAKMTISTK